MKNLTTRQLIKLTEKNQGHLMGTVMLEDNIILEQSWEIQSFDLVNTAIEGFTLEKCTGKEYTYQEAHEDEQIRFAFKVLVDACPDEEKVAHFENLTIIKMPMTETCMVYLMYI